MKILNLASRAVAWALILSFALGLPYPALAMRPEPLKESAGLEELASSLTGPEESRVVHQVLAAVRSNFRNMDIASLHFKFEPELPHQHYILGPGKSRWIYFHADTEDRNGFIGRFLLKGGKIIGLSNLLVEPNFPYHFGLFVPLKEALGEKRAAQAREAARQFIQAHSSELEKIVGKPDARPEYFLAESATRGEEGLYDMFPLGVGKEQMNRDVPLFFEGGSSRPKVILFRKLTKTPPIDRDSIRPAAGLEEFSEETFGRREDVFQLALHPSGRFAAKVLSDGSVVLDDLSGSGLAPDNLYVPEEQALDQHARKVAFTADGTVIGVLRRDGWIGLYDAYTRRGFAKFRHEYGALDFAFSPDGPALASTGLDGSIRIWHLPPRTEISSKRPPFKLIEAYQHWSSVVAFAPDGRHFASSGYNGNRHKIHLWDLEQTKIALGLQDHQAPVQSLAFSPDGQRLASVSLDGALKVWDLASRRVIQELSSNIQHASSQVRFSPDGRWLAWAEGPTGRVQVLEVPAGVAKPLSPIRIYRETPGRSLNTAIFSPDGKFLWVGGTGPALRKISLESSDRPLRGQRMVFLLPEKMGMPEDSIGERVGSYSTFQEMQKRLEEIQESSEKEGRPIDRVGLQVGEILYAHSLSGIAEDLVGITPALLQDLVLLDPDGWILEYQLEMVSSNLGRRTLRITPLLSNTPAAGLEETSRRVNDLSADEAGNFLLMFISGEGTITSLDAQPWINSAGTYPFRLGQALRPFYELYVDTRLIEKEIPITAPGRHLMSGLLGGEYSLSETIRALHARLAEAGDAGFPSVLRDVYTEAKQREKLLPILLKEAEAWGKRNDLELRVKNLPIDWKPGVITSAGMEEKAGAAAGRWVAQAMKGKKVEQVMEIDAADAVRRHGAGVITKLRELLSSRRDSIRMKATLLLGSAGRPAAESLPELRKRLFDRHPLVRIFAATAIEQIGVGDAETLSALREAAEWNVGNQHPDKDLQEALKQAIRTLAPKRSVASVPAYPRWPPSATAPEPKPFRIGQPAPSEKPAPPVPSMDKLRREALEILSRFANRRPEEDEAADEPIPPRAILLSIGQTRRLSGLLLPLGDLLRAASEIRTRLFQNRLYLVTMDRNLRQRFPNHHFLTPVTAIDALEDNRPVYLLKNYAEPQPSFSRIDSISTPLDDRSGPAGLRRNLEHVLLRLLADARRENLFQFSQNKTISPQIERLAQILEQLSGKRPSHAAGLEEKSAVRTPVRIVVAPSAFAQVPGLHQTVRALQQSGLEEYILALPEGDLPQEELTDRLSGMAARLLSVPSHTPIGYGDNDDPVAQQFGVMMASVHAPIVWRHPAALWLQVEQILTGLGFSQSVAERTADELLSLAGLEEAA